MEFFYNEFVESIGDTATTWRVIHKLDLNKSMDSSCLSMASNVKELNNYFVNVGKRAKLPQSMTENNNTPQIPTMSHNLELYKLQPVDASTVIPTIKQLKNRNSCGSYDMTFWFLRDALLVITLNLKCIINTSIVTYIVTHCWKQSQVTLILKSRVSDDPGNYRPIYFLSIISKILEKIIAMQLVNLFKSKNCQVEHSTDSGQVYPQSRLWLKSQIIYLKTWTIKEQSPYSPYVTCLKLLTMSAMKFYWVRCIIWNLFILISKSLNQQNSVCSHWRQYTLKVACAFWCSPGIYFRPHIVQYLF